MQNDPIQGILFDAEMVVRFDKPTPEIGHKSVNVMKTFKKFTNRFNRNNKNVTKTLRYELMEDSHRYTIIRPTYRVKPKTLIKK